MEENPTWITVVAAALQSSDRRWLMQKRASGRDHAGLWEFPGGKVEIGETPANALVRELAEELSISLPPSRLTPAFFAEESETTGRAPIVILLYTITISDTIRGVIPCHGVGGESRWFTARAMEVLPKPPLDCRLMTGLVRIGALK